MPRADRGYELVEACAEHILAVMRADPWQRAAPDGPGLKQTEILHASGLFVHHPLEQESMQGWFIKALLAHVVASKGVTTTGHGSSRRYHLAP